MERARRALIVATVTVLLLATATVGVGAVGSSVADAAGTTGSATDGDRHAADAPADVEIDRADPPTRCFAGEGYPISIGETGATIDAVVHLSVLTDPAVGNEFGLEAAGSIGDDRILTLAAGVRLTAREAIADGVDPFAAFNVLYAYELRLPMFDGAIDDTEYRDEGSPVASAAGVVPC